MISKDEVIEWIGGKRAEKIEQIKPGAIEAGIAAIGKTTPESQALPLAGIRAIQAAGLAPNADDLKRWKAATTAAAPAPVETTPTETASVETAPEPE